MSYSIGVDVGGTFTDFFVLDETAGVVKVHKRPSTPHNPAEAIILGLDEIAERFALDLTEVGTLSHGTTVATNALIQKTGAEVAVVTTRGFRDLIEIGRQTRPDMFSLQTDHPQPLSPRRNRLEIAERTLHDGSIETPVTDAALTDLAQRLSALDVESAAICFLFAHVNAENEQRTRDAIAAAMPDLSISISSEVQPEFREYERFSTTVLNAYLQPLMKGYLDHLEREAKARMNAIEVGIYQSSGGVMSLDTARRFPVRTALSGPAAGAVGAAWTASQTEDSNVITLDMGGTSADVALIENYRTAISTERSVAGFPVRQPVVDIHTVGAGGGSIAWREADGLLKVGPHSAGARPGPACYGHGGEAFTVTDANAVLGRFARTGIAGGAMALDIDRSRDVARPLAEELGLSMEALAEGVIDIVTSNMVRAIRAITVEHGHDPQDYALMGFGGAGPLHAADVARMLGMKRVIIPATPGILCAQGLLISERQESFVSTAFLTLSDESARPIRETLATLMKDAAGWFDSEGAPAEDRRGAVRYDMRYRGQNFELPIEFPLEWTGATVPEPDLPRLTESFFDMHDRFYGFHSEDDPIEIVNIRVIARWGGRSDLRLAPPARGAGGPEPLARQTVRFNGADHETEVFDRADLPAGHVLVGPTIITQLDTTTIVGPGDRLTILDSGNMLIEVAA